jgi:hypothetical protein
MPRQYACAVRSRELWLWLGGALLTLGTVLSAIAIAYFTKFKHFSLYTSWQSIAAVTVFGLAFIAFLGAILGWPFRLRQPRFPNVDVTIATKVMVPFIKTEMYTGHTLTWARHPRAHRLTITNNETERPVSIDLDVWMKMRSDQPREWWSGWLEPSVPPELAHMNVAPLLQLPVNLQPHESRQGWIYQEFDQPPYMGMLADPLEGRIRLIDRNGPWRAYVPQVAGHYTRRQLETERGLPKSLSPNPDASGKQGSPRLMRRARSLLAWGSLRGRVTQTASRLYGILHGPKRGRRQEPDA